MFYMEKNKSCVHLHDRVDKVWNESNLKGDRKYEAA
jgi:hypothetical protein